MKNESFVVNSTSRIEAFSDGVFAIAITLLILELKVPVVTVIQDKRDLMIALKDLWPSYFAYVFSFIIIGIYWLNHHYIFQLFKRVNHTFGILNLFFLMSISFLPFPTAVLAEYLDDDVHRFSAVTFYTFGLLLPAIAWTANWIYGSKEYRLIDHNLSAEFIGKLTRLYSWSTVVYVLALILSLINEWLGLATCVILTLHFLFPPVKPVYKERLSVQN
ncbi:TMEM175 family protein [Peredibacter starrii]|uniref:TMEM175 family protein n=1 Tax=Peredibacter starrii TaxID=28202 RepID=A0AAX4HTX1_9BACT|nr:TMEM175 family protein [Peredibacter starrii]WPU66737.1 TMEM175 family protein [Peredibacter starrii]